MRHTDVSTVLPTDNYALRVGINEDYTKLIFRIENLQSGKLFAGVEVLPEEAMLVVEHIPRLIEEMKRHGKLMYAN